MFDSETRWFIRCDTCPDDGVVSVHRHPSALDKDAVADWARLTGWEIRDDLHRCRECVREGRLAGAS
jgi:hypothetical protein